MLNRQARQTDLLTEMTLYGGSQVLCGRWNDADYKAARCSPDEFYNRYTQYGISRVWR